jgi:hypothetical protein
MRISRILVRSIANLDYIIFKGICRLTTSGSRNGAGRVYPVMDAETLNSSNVTVILQRHAMRYWTFLGFGEVGEPAHGIK